MSISSLRNAGEWALMVALVFGAGAIAQANDEPTKTDGPVVQIGRTDGGEASPFKGLPTPEQNAAPKYWIGLLGGAIPADHPLRAHLDLPENQGLLVANIVPNSPAAKAGLKKHDILLKANDAELHEMTDLVGLVASEGEKKAQITLEVFRRGNRESIYLTPEERPADAPVAQGPAGGGFGGVLGGEGGLPEGFPQELLQQFGGEGNNPFAFRNFGNGIFLGSQGFANMPNGVSVSVQKEGDGPAKITVKRGNDTWEVTGDDAESLNQLPEDLRPFVAQMMQGGGPTINLQRRERLQQRLDGEDGRLRERIERMEKRMQEFMDRYGRETKPAEQPKAEAEQSK
jgi:membrane-associated protease RseP (regulator of RpoE activity)